MKDHFIITIGRQFGSGGKDIGIKLAEKLGVKCYDKELLAIAAKESGLCEEIFEMHDEKPTSSFLYSIVMDSYAGIYNPQSLIDMPINQKVFLAQFDTIKKIAEKESCVIVGRCADYALDERNDVMSVFLSADLDERVKKIASLYQIKDSKAKDMISKTDKKRAGYYNYYTNKVWGDASSYDICLNTSKLTTDKVVEILCNYLEIR